MSNLFGEEFIEGFEVLNDYLSFARQAALVAACRRVCKVTPLWRPVYRIPVKGIDKTIPFALENTNCGLYGWQGTDAGFEYSRTDKNGRRWQLIPDEILQIVRELKDAGKIPKHFIAENCLINYYEDKRDADGKVRKSHLGLHQDRTEPNRRAPIISISLGLSCVFQIGGLEKSAAVAEVVLKSGDVVVMGGGLRGARNAFHGVKALLPGTMPDGLMKAEARINVTIRQVD